MKILKNFILHVTAVLGVDLTTEVGLRLWHLDYVLNNVMLWHLILESVDLLGWWWWKRERWFPVDSIEEFLWHRRQGVGEVLNLLTGSSHQALSLLVLVGEVLLDFLAKTWLGNRGRAVELRHLELGLGHEELWSWHNELRLDVNWRLGPGDKAWDGFYILDDFNGLWTNDFVVAVWFRDERKWLRNE